MKKISLKASIAVVSLSLVLTPFGFAQSPGGSKLATTLATADTQPLPGAKVAGVEALATGLGISAGAATALIAAIAIVGFATAITIAQNSSNDDAAIAAIIAAASATTTSTK